MGKTAVEKILARCAGKDQVKAGDVVWAKPDLVTMPDASILNILSEMKSLGLEKPFDPDRVVVVSDHRVFLNSDRDAGVVRRIREEVCKPGFCRFFDVGRHGLTHHLPVEKGFALPGQFIASLDTQATTLGGIGAFAVPVFADIIFVLATGSIWMRVPRTVRIILNGRIAPGVDARDVILYLLREVGWDAADYRALEFLGPVVDEMDVDERMTLCNGVVQIGAKAGFVAADEVTLDYFRGRAAAVPAPVASDPDAEFERVLEFDLSCLEPQIAAPPSPDNSAEVRRYAGKRVDWAFIAGCASARMHDLRVAAAILKGRRISDRVRMVVSPASQEVFKAAMREGLLDTFIEAGVMVTPPTCGPCYGEIIHLSDGEVCVGTGTRNEPGRMGSREAEVYLASPATVAACAVAGEIIDPRELAG